MYRLLLPLLLIACVTSFAKAATAAVLPPVKKLVVTANADGEIFVGRDTVQTDKLAFEIQTRLWKSYLGTGKMHDSIQVVFEGEVLMGTKGSVLDAIKEGMEKALEILCVDKYKKTYEKLSATQQQKVRKQFPVLFQELSW